MSVVDKARSMEETSRNLQTFAKMAYLDVDSLHKQYEYIQQHFKTLEDGLQQFIANISSIFVQLASINRTSGNRQIFLNWQRIDKFSS